MKQTAPKRLCYLPTLSATLVPFFRCKPAVGFCEITRPLFFREDLAFVILPTLYLAVDDPAFAAPSIRACARAFPARVARCCLTRRPVHPDELK